MDIARGFVGVYVLSLTGPDWCPARFECLFQIQHGLCAEVFDINAGFFGGAGNEIL
jgi:hypothetical protein